LEMRLGGPQSQSGRCEEEKISCRFREFNAVSCIVARYLGSSIKYDLKDSFAKTRSSFVGWFLMLQLGNCHLCFQPQLVGVFVTHFLFEHPFGELRYPVIQHRVNPRFNEQNSSVLPRYYPADLSVLPCNNLVDVSCMSTLQVVLRKLHLTSTYIFLWQIVLYCVRFVLFYKYFFLINTPWTKKKKGQTWV
jgi:hypothetical protein